MVGTVDSPRAMVRSTLWLTAGQVGSMMLTLGFFAIVARALGESGLGRFSWLIAALNIVAIIPEFGMSPIIVRDLARSEEEAGSLLGSSMVLRTLLFMCSAGAFGIAALMFRLDGELVTLSWVMMANIIISSKLTVYRHAFEALYRARLTMHVPVLLALLDGLVALVLLVIVSRDGIGLSKVVWVYTLANIPGFLVLLIAVFGKRRIRLTAQWTYAKRLLSESYPIAIYAVLMAVYGNADVLMLDATRGSADVGIYGAAMRLALPWIFLATAVNSSLFPTLSRIAKGENGKLGDSFLMGVKILSVLGVALALFGGHLADLVVSVLYGSSYIAAGPVLRLLLWGQLFALVSLFLLNTNIALGRQRINAACAAVLVLASVGLNSFVLARWGGEGAAAIRTSCEAAGCAILLVSMPRAIVPGVLTLSLKLAVAAIVTGLVLLVPAALWVTGGFGACVFALLVHSLHVFEKKEIASLTDVFKGWVA